MRESQGHSRYLLPLSYLIVGVAWVVGSDYVLGEATDVPIAAHVIASLKGILFVVATATLLYFVQARPKANATSVPARLVARLGGGAIRPVLIFCITSAGVLLAGTMLFRQQVAEVQLRAAESLTNTTALITRQIELRMDDSVVNLEFAGRDPLLAGAVLALRNGGGRSAHADLTGGLDVLRQSETYDSVQMFSPEGAPLAHAGQPIALTAPLQYWIRGATLTGRVVMSDVYVPAESRDGKPVFDFVVAVMHDGSPGALAGVLVVRVDPDKHVFPAISGAKASAPDVSFALVHRSADDVAILLPPERRRLHDRLSYEERVSGNDSAPSQVARGLATVFTAKDDAGVPVIATGRALGSTPWFLVATVPQHAILAPLQRAGYIALLLTLAGLAVSGWFVSVWWQREREVMAGQVDAAERRTTLLKEHFAIAGRFVHDIVLLLDDTDATIIEANDRAVVAYGYTRDELLERTIFDLRPAGSVAQAEARQRFAAMRGTGGGSFQTHHWRQDGTSFPIEISARFCELDGRRYVQMVGRDITERLDHEARLATLSVERDRVLERLQRQFDQMATACIVLSAEGNVLQINPAHQRVFGYGPEHVVGRNVHDFVRSAEFLRSHDEWFAQLRRDPEATLVGIYENVTLAGKPITCRWTATALRDAAGQFNGLIGMAEDITEQIVAERTLQLEQSKNAAEHSDRVKSAFLSTMSHELRTPLNSILGFTDVLLQGLSGPLEDAQQRQLQIVRDSAAHLRSLIEDVLDISRIEAGQISLEFSEIDLRDLVARRIEAFGPEYERKGIALQVQVQEPLPALRSDRKRVDQVVNNLLSNALKFTDTGTVTVDLRRVGDCIELAVIDTGMGIPANALVSLFNPFTQVIRPGGRMHEGTGLGLAISRNLARALGGDVTVESEVGRGSRFTFRLPLVAREVDAASASGTFSHSSIRRAIASV